MQINQSGMQETSLELRNPLTDQSGFAGEPEKAKVLVSERPRRSSESQQDLIAANQKLQMQNEKLRAQLKELSYKLTETLEKVKKKKPSSEKLASELREETLRRELDNASRQAQFYQKEAERLRFRIETTHTAERVTKLEDMVRDKERVIDELVIEKRNLEKLKRDQEKQLDVLKNERDFSTKLKMYAEEVKGLRDKIREMQQQEKQAEKGYKKQQEYLVNLEGKFREVCDKAGVSSSMNYTTAQEMDERGQRFKFLRVRDASIGGEKDLKKGVPLSTRSDRHSIELMNNSVEEENIELTEGKFKELRSMVKILKKAKEAADRRYKADIDQLVSKIKELEFDNSRLKSDMRDKEKELNIAVYKFNELKRISKPNMLAPIELNEGSKRPDRPFERMKSPSQPNIIALIKPSPQKQLASGKREKRGRVNIKAQEFDDFSVATSESKISKLTVWFDQDRIYGLSAVYSLANGTEVDGKDHLQLQNKDKIVARAFEVDPDDRIAVISGRFKSFIGYLKVATAKGVIHEFGSETGKNSAQHFIFDTEANEAPSVMFGALDKIEIDGDDCALAYLGFQITKVESRDDINDDIPESRVFITNGKIST